jgi:hypothetical protein
MTKQLSLFPDSPKNLSNNLKDGSFADFETIFNPVDEMFAASTRFRDNRDFIELLQFIARFPDQDLELQNDTSYLILIDRTHSMEDRYSSLAHELGHIFCSHLGIDRHAWWPEREDLSINSEEIESDATAYLVCERLGLGASSAEHLSNYIETNHELPVFSLNAVLQSVGYLEDMGKSRWKEPRRRRRQ